MTKREFAILALFSVFWFFLGTNLVHITDPVESNYVLTAKEMIESGDYFSPRIHGHYWYDKPIMFYLELIAAFKILGYTDFAARLFPAIFGVLGIFLTYFFGKKLYGAKVGFISAVLLGCSLEYWYIAHAIITDMTLFVTMTGTLAAYFVGYRHDKPLYYYVAYALAGISVLTKGPIGIVLPGMIIVIFLLWEGKIKALLNKHIFLGFVLFLAVCAIWYLPMYLQHGFDFIATFLGVHNVLRATVSEHPRDNNFYYYFLILLAGFFPWSFYLLPKLPAKIKQFWFDAPVNFFRRITSPEMRFLTVWAVTVFVLFNSFATKYVTYTFPYMVPIAIMMARHFAEREALFKKMAIVATAFYTITLFFIVAPMLNERSAYDNSDTLMSLVTEDTEVMMYGKNYQTSLCYYSGVDIAKVDIPRVIKEIQPKAMDWTSTNAMRLVSLDELPKDKDILVITNSENEDYFLEYAAEYDGSEWEKVGHVENADDDAIFYRRVKN